MLITHFNGFLLASQPSFLQKSLCVLRYVITVSYEQPGFIRKSFRSSNKVLIVYQHIYLKHMVQNCFSVFYFYLIFFDIVLKDSVKQGILMNQ